MKKRHVTYLKLNIISLFFIAVSFTSITLAWFAYSGIAKTTTKIDVKAWHISFDKENDPETNNITISVPSIYPGMQTAYDSINIKNLGDSDAKLSYKVDSVTILGNTTKAPLSFGYLEDKIANDYPFSVNVSLDKKYIEAKTGEAAINIAVSWPFDSGDDKFDSDWGNLAYNYQNNPENEGLPAIKVNIKINAEQTMDKYLYNSGDVLLYDVVNDTKCSEIKDSCISTRVLSPNYHDGQSILLLPNLLSTYETNIYDEFDNLRNSISSSWSVTTKPFELSFILDFLSEDLNKSLLVRETLSDSLIGYKGYKGDILRYDDYMTKKVLPYNSYFKFDNDRYNYLATSNCYWLNEEYDDTRAFALVKDDTLGNIIVPYLKTNKCSSVPVIEISKEKLNYQ